MPKVRLPVTTAELATRCDRCHGTDGNSTDPRAPALAAQRAAVLLGLVAGVQIMRQMIGLSALTDADPADLKAILEPLIQTIVVAQTPDDAPRNAAAR